MPFTDKELEPIARTILGYEQERPKENQIIATRSIGVLLSGTSNHELSYTLNLKLGALPPWTSRWDNQAKGAYAEQCHPLEYAAAFEDDDKLRTFYLDHFREDVLQAQSEQSQVKIIDAPRELPGPRDKSWRLDTGVARFFRPQHAPWYQPHVLSRLATEQMTYQTGIGHFLREISASLERAGEDNARVRQVATTCVVKELKKKATNATDYAALAEAIYLADQDQVAQDLEKSTGTLQVLAACLVDPPSPLMIRALRTMASTGRLEVLQYLRRAPTANELLGSNVKGAGDIWRLIPWTLLEDVVRDPAHGPALRAGLLKRTELSPSQMRQCFSDHEGRYIAVEEKHARRAAGRHAQYDEFEQWKKGVRRYHAAENVRLLLKTQYPRTQNVAGLIALQHVTGRDDLKHIVEPMITPKLRAALAAYPAPLRVGNKDSATPWYSEIT